MKLCECGCGSPTSIAKRTNREKGHVKGQPVRFLTGHHSRTAVAPACGYTVDPETGCWLWALRVNEKGYGRIKVSGRTLYAHIHFYEMANGPVPAGLELDHLCLNRACCNPAHLEPVTHLENVRRSSAAKLTLETAQAIRECSLSNSKTALLFGVSKTTVSEVRSGLRWAAA